MRRFRLLEPVPLLVEFKSATFRLKLDVWEMPPSWKLVLYVNASRYRYFYLEGYSSAERANAGLYVDGFTVNRGTVAETVLLRMVRDGNAVEV